MSTESTLQATIQALVQDGKGLLAADESGPTIAKRFKTIAVESTEENRRVWRTLLLSTPGLGEFVSGVILYEETLGQRADDGTPLPELAARQQIVPGIKVDAGKIPLALAPGDEITQNRRACGTPRRLPAARRAVREMARGVQRVRHAAGPRGDRSQRRSAGALCGDLPGGRRRADRRAGSADGRRSFDRPLRK